jgi:hypothetical protein
VSAEGSQLGPRPADQTPEPGNRAPPGADPSLAPYRLDMSDLLYDFDIEPGLLVVIADPSGVLRGSDPSGRFGRGDVWTELSFRDDGESPDGQAGDGQFVAWVEDYPRGGMTEIRLYGADGTLLYQDSRIPLPWSRDYPIVALLLLPEGGHIPTIDTNDLGESDFSDSRPSQGSEDEGGGNASHSPEDTLPAALTQAVDAVEQSQLSRWILLGLGLVGSLSLTWLAIHRRARKSHLRPAGEPVPLEPEALKAPSVWVLQSDRQRVDVLVALAKSRQGSGRVLIFPRPESREVLRSALRGLDMVLWSEVPRPSVTQIDTLSSFLAEWGRGLIVVEGVGSVEGIPGDPFSSESLRELLERAPVGIDLRILLTPDESREGLECREMDAGDLTAQGLTELVYDG